MTRALPADDQQVYADQTAYPVELLDRYLELAGHTRAIAMAAIRTRSLAARSLLAHAATRHRPLDALLAAARAGAADRLPPGGVNGWGLTHLARTLALQDLLPTDRSDAIACYELALRLSGPDRISRYHQGLHAQLVYQAGDRGRAATLLDQYRRMPPAVRSYLELDLANPFADGDRADPAGWLARFARLLPEPAPTLAPATETATPFDRLTGDAGKVQGGRTISVVVTAYRPGPGLATAVRSLLAQSWPDLEILIVDDGSPSEYDPVLEACLALDDRVKLLRQPANAGTYAARNAGLDAATGEFVTFQDSDDWSHPRRLADQVAPLLRDPALVATVSDGLRVTDRLVITHTPGRDPYAVVPSSLMLRKAAVLARIGYFDAVRREADSEYLGRLQAAFGPAALERLRANYSLIRYTPNSLSRTDIRPGWMHPARLAYKSAYHLWHRQIAAGEAPALVARHPTARPFAAPAYIRGEPAATVRLDVLFAGDWRLPGATHRSMVDEMVALTNRGLRVGVLQLESFRYLPERHEPLGRPVQELINTGRVAQVFTADELTVPLIFITSPSVLQFPTVEPCRINAGRVVIRAGGPPAGCYTPAACAAAATRLFSAAPVWAPRGSRVRAELAPGLAPASLLPADLPEVVDLASLRTDRTAPVRPDLPVIGLHFTDPGAAAPAGEPLRQVSQGSPGADVRLLGRTAGLAERLGFPRLPASWLAYDLDELGVRAFLQQLDFYLAWPPVAGTDPVSRPVLEALAAGCVVIAPRRLAGAFGDAALYRDPPELPETLRDYHAGRDRYLAQSRRAREWVRQHYREEAYVSVVSGLVGDATNAEGSETP
ncbi:MAG TPA: glycosyltransferase [Natronosporangium sp.]